MVVGRDEAQHGQEGQAEDGEGVRAWCFLSSAVEGQVEVGREEEPQAKQWEQSPEFRLRATSHGSDLVHEMGAHGIEGTGDLEDEQACKNEPGRGREQRDASGQDQDHGRDDHEHECLTGSPHEPAQVSEQRSDPEQLETDGEEGEPAHRPAMLLDELFGSFPRSHDVAHRGAAEDVGNGKGPEARPAPTIDQEQRQPHPDAPRPT